MDTNRLLTTETQTENTNHVEETTRNDVSFRVLYLYIFDMISIIYNLTLSHGLASRKETVETLTSHIATLRDRAGFGGPR